jgi:hypothetical protein
MRIDDFALRYAAALRCALQENITVCSAINPSTLHLFGETLAAGAADLAASLDEGRGPAGVGDVGVVWRKDPAAARRVRESAAKHGRARMRDAFPNLCGLVTWKGGASSWWLSRLQDSYGTLPTLDYGYAASEGCFGAPLDTDGAASLLLPHGHLVELIPEGGSDDDSVFLDEAEVGQHYAVLVTTSSGLYRYRMHDVVEVTGRCGRAPLAVFRHKEGTMTSITGEKLGEAHVATALRDVGFVGAGVCLAPFYQDPVCYVAAVEGDLDAAAFDRALCAANEEYDAKRKSLRLGPVVVVGLAAGSFVAARARRVGAGAPDAHVKVPTLSRDGALLKELGVPAAIAASLQATP